MGYVMKDEDIEYTINVLSGLFAKGTTIEYAKEVLEKVIRKKCQHAFVDGVRVGSLSIETLVPVNILMPIPKKLGIRLKVLTRLKQ